MDHSFRSDAPLYPQIAAWLKRAIVDGAFPTGERLPSIRELALRLSVTPNTLQRALQLLESEGLIYTERTNGKFVTGDGARLAKLREELLRGQVRTLADDLRRCGYTKEEVIVCLVAEWEK